jgi:rod shape-determining protein MreB and related proteins
MKTASLPEISAPAQNSTAEAPVSAKNTLVVGLDWGTNMSSIMASPYGSSETTISEQIPTVVGYTPDNVLDNVIPGDAKRLFGRMALKYQSHLEIVRPLKGGVIADLEAARLFAQHLRGILGSPREIRAVIGMPASSDLVARENARNAVTGVFHKVLFVPEPFLAALGFRDETKLTDPKYNDPVLNSLYIDIGAGSSDVCLVQGHYPTIEDQLSAPFAGDAVDQIILDSALATYPDCGLSLTRIREIKEQFSFVSSTDSSKAAVATIMVGGKVRKIDLTQAIQAGCDALLNRVFEMTRDLIARANPDTAAELLQNIIVTGGGSLIKGFGPALQAKLQNEGFANPRVNILGENYKDYVAKGALKAARHAKDRQWQTLLG